MVGFQKFFVFSFCQDSEITMEQGMSCHLCEDILPSEVAMEHHLLGVHGVIEREPSVSVSAVQSLKFYQ